MHRPGKEISHFCSEVVGQKSNTRYYTAERQNSNAQLCGCCDAGVRKVQSWALSVFLIFFNNKKIFCILSNLKLI